MNLLGLVGRKSPLFRNDIMELKNELSTKVRDGSFLVVGGAGTIGKAVVKELFRREPRKLHVVDISENNLVELVRDIRSSFGYISGDFDTFALDVNSPQFLRLFHDEGCYDYVLNLTAMKHVRSEKDIYSLDRLIEVNVLNAMQLNKLCLSSHVKKYFCVSTDKAANPTNLMGASKLIMEKFLFSQENDQRVSTARFANVAFSDGSLLHGFNQRFIMRQPISAPMDTMRYFVTPQESGELCLLSLFFAGDKEILFPKLGEELKLENFSKIADRYIRAQGYEPYICESESEAREMCASLIAERRWPLYLFETDTTGEKLFEEFYTDTEELDLTRFHNVGVIKNPHSELKMSLDEFETYVTNLKKSEKVEKNSYVELISKIIPELQHEETHKNLNQRM